MAVKEAIACGTPVVAVDLPGVRALLKYAPTTLLLAEPEPESIAARLHEAISAPIPALDTVRRQRLALAAAGLTPDAHLRRTLDLLGVTP